MAPLTLLRDSQQVLPLLTQKVYVSASLVPAWRLALVVRIQPGVWLPAYSWVNAVEFEETSSLDFRPPAEFVPMVLAKAQVCVEQQVPYSVLKQTDCDSLTRWVYMDERWNRQLATTVGGLVLATLVFAVVDSFGPQKRRRS
ncbi:MAG TPA: hypothetical protein VME17_23520 [Bryobacteraceae bacterium]|nr:hypothetical protein [Bryobacteraceae bacterium]